MPGTGLGKGISNTPAQTVAPAANEMFVCEVTYIAEDYRGDFRLFFIISPFGTVPETITGLGVSNQE